MAHLFILRSVDSFVECEGAVYGMHERIERSIVSDPINFSDGTFNGKCVPNSSEWKLLEYRLKEECIPEFVKKLGGTMIILNPKNNDVTLWKLLFGKKKKFFGDPSQDINKTSQVSVGNLFMWVMYGFKLLNRVGNLFGFQLCGVDGFSGDVNYYMKKGYCYHYCLGYVKDPRTEHGEEL